MHADLWSELWNRWLLSGNSLSIQWVPSHVGVDGKECADQKTAKGAKMSHEQALKHKAVMDIWAELGLQEMPDTFDSDSNESKGS